MSELDLAAVFDAIVTREWTQPPSGEVVLPSDRFAGGEALTLEEWRERHAAAYGEAD